MKLNRRYIRNIRENLSFYLSATVLTVVTLLLYFLFNIAGNAILDFGAAFFQRNLLEDAHFSTYLPIPSEEIAALETEYGLTLEAQRYINLETDGVTARVFERTRHVDLYEVTAGRDVENDGEIVMSEGYAAANGIRVGDHVRIRETSYQIVGLMQRPDYLYMLENEDDSYKNISTFYLCYMSDADFDRLGAASAQYLVRYGAASDAAAFRKAVHAQYYMRSYSAAGENPRILMVEQQAEMFVVMAYVLLCVLPLIAVALVSIIISRKVKCEQRMIGALSAMGYRKGQLIRHYAGFAALPGLAGGILTAVIAAAAAQPFSEMGLQDYEPMHLVGRLNPVDAILGVVIPTAMYVLAACLFVRKLLKRDTVLLLNGSAGGGAKRLKRVLAGRKLSFRVKFAVRSLIGNPARSFVVALGVFLGCFITLLGLAFFDSIDHMSHVAADAMGSFTHQYILGELLEENPYGGETLLVSALEDEKGRTASVIGTSSGSAYFRLEDPEGNAVSVDDGYYITSLAALAFGWHAGEQVTVYHPLTLEKREITIAGVLQNNVQKSIVTSKDLAASLTGLDADRFNCIISGEALPIPEAKIVQTLQASDIEDQVKTMTAQMDFLLWMIVGLGVVICIAAVYVAVNMMVTENRSNISMLKVLGYRERQINRIVLRSHHILLPIGILLSVPATHWTCGVFFKWMVDYGVMLVDAYISPLSYALAIGLTALCYFASLWLLRRKVHGVDMIESLKDNRE